MILLRDFIVAKFLLGVSCIKHNKQNKALAFARALKHLTGQILLTALLLA